MIKFEQHHHKIFIKSSTEDELEFMKKKLKFFSPSFGFSFGKNFTVDNILNNKDSSFPSAYLTRLCEKLDSKDFEYSIDDMRTFPGGRYNFILRNTLPPLWENQKEALEAIKKNNVGIIASATGSGKSRLILESVLERNCKTLIIVPTENIRDQLEDLFTESLGKKNVTTKPPKRDSDYYLKEKEDKFVEEENEIKVEKEGIQKLQNLFSDNPDEDASSKKNPLDKLKNLYSHSDYDDKNISPEEQFKQDKGLYKYKDNNDRYEKERNKKIKSIRKKIKPITIICYQSLPNISKEFLKEIECLIIDECHQASAETIRENLLLMENAAYRYFFSATPWRDLSSQMELLISSIGENLIYELKGKDAADKEIISKPKYRLINPDSPKEWLRDIPKRKYRELLERGIIGNEVRNQTIVDEAMDLYENDYNVFIAVDEISHLMILQKRLEDKGVEPYIIHGDMDTWEKNKNIKTVGETKGPCISIGTMAVGIGTDMPNINAVIIASGGKSSIRFLQRIGRGARKTNDEKDFLVIDFFDWYHETLIKHSKERQKIFEKEFDIDPDSYVPKQ